MPIDRPNSPRRVQPQNRLLEWRAADEQLPQNGRAYYADEFRVMLQRNALEGAQAARNVLQPLVRLLGEPGDFVGRVQVGGPPPHHLAGALAPGDMGRRVEHRDFVVGDVGFQAGWQANAAPQQPALWRRALALLPFGDVLATAGAALAGAVVGAQREWVIELARAHLRANAVALDVHAAGRDAAVRNAYQSLLAGRIAPNPNEVTAALTEILASLRQQSAANPDLLAEKQHGLDAAQRAERVFNRLRAGEKYQLRYPDLVWPMSTLAAFVWRCVAAYEAPADPAQALPAATTEHHRALMQQAFILELGRCYGICAAGQAQHLILALQGYFPAVAIDPDVPDVPPVQDYVKHCARTCANTRRDGSRVYADLQAWADDTYQRAARVYQPLDLVRIRQEIVAFADLQGETWQPIRLDWVI